MHHTVNRIITISFRRGVIMSEIDWNTKLEYLNESRKSWFNLDYIEFLVKNVWHINKPIKVADFGCGNGFLGSVLLPLLPEGSSYTGFDSGTKLLVEAINIFSKTSYKTEFINCDLMTDIISEQYDLVVCQAFLMHITRPEYILDKMINATLDGGLVICIETNWNVGNAAMYIDGLDIDGYCNLGLLSKLWKREKSEQGTDKCIGMKIPAMMQKAGLKNTNIRMNDCVRFANPYADKIEYNRQLQTFLADGWGREIGDEDDYVQALNKRGVTVEEAHLQFQCEKEINEFVKKEKDNLMVLSIPPMFISYGTK